MANLLKQVRSGANGFGRRFTAKEVSDHLGIYTSSVFAFENESKRPGKKTKVRIAEFLGVSVHDIWPEDAA